MRDPRLDSRQPMACPIVACPIGYPCLINGVTVGDPRANRGIVDDPWVVHGLPPLRYGWVIHE